MAGATRGRCGASWAAAAGARTPFLLLLFFTVPAAFLVAFAASADTPDGSSFGFSGTPLGAPQASPLGPSTEYPQDVSGASSSGPGGFSEQFASALSSLGPLFGQFLSSGESGGASSGAGALGALYDMGRRAAGALSASIASDEAREGMWVPLHEQLGLARDMLGLPGDDAQGVRSAARLLLAAQLPIVRFAAEREASDDEEADRRALRIVTEYPTTKKMLADYMEQKPDRNIRAAPAELIRLHEEMKEHLKAFRAAAASNILPVSILGALDSLSNEAALKVNGYLATVARYLTYTDRFSKNKRGLVFFARHMLPRLLQLFALQLDACRHLWRFLSFASPRETLTGPLTFKPSLSPSGAAAAAAAAAAAGAAEGADEDSSFGSEVDPSAAAAAAAAAHAPSLPVALTVHDSEAGGPLRTLAQNLGVHLPTVPHADARAFGRRLLARVQVHIGALYALAQGCLAATALSFQREYAEAEDRVELGEAPAAAFLSLRGQSECVEKSSSKKSKGKETAKENAAEESGRDGQPTEPQKKQSHRLRALNRGRPAGSAATAAAAAGNPNDAERTS